MKKKTVKLVSAVVVLGVLSGTYVGVKSYVAAQEEKESEASDKSVELVSIESDDVTSVSFTAGDSEVEFDKSDDTWTNKSDSNFPVNQDTVDSAVKGVASLTADQEITDVDDLSKYDLDDPQNTITLSTDDGDTVLEIGMESSSQYYVKKADEDDKVYLVSSSSIEPFMGDLYDFAQSGTFPSITTATITDVNVDKDDAYELTEDEDSLFWNVTDGTNTEKADSTSAGNVTSAIGSLSYDKFVDYNCTDDSKYGFDDPYAVITVKYTEEEEVESDDDDSSDDTDSESTDSTDSEDTSDDSTDADSEDTSDDSTDADSEDTLDDSSTDSDSDDSDETETVTVDKTLTIYIGDETGEDRYIKVNDSNEVYTISSDSLTEITDKKAEDFYSLTVNYISRSDIDSFDMTDANGSHEVTITRVTTKDSDDEDAEETTTTTYKYDGTEIEESDFTTLYNKVINLTAQKRLTDEYNPENDPTYTFVFKKTDGTEVTEKIYEYDTNFYAAVVGDKVYLINKMNIKELTEAYDTFVNGDTDTEESTDSEDTTSDDSTDTSSDDSTTEKTE